ncbi:CRISPR-associated endonuclease Cas2 [Pseudodesulfovibrio thermohalotolerans]|uniref:CRISPR-associated endonuclease Cas2 n=1 Tax=Pseudodesulfovibrio thermohalotolerans TaxID=2880651 RepID=UPI0022B9FF4A|nr:CRISPR-associated endonuclease Cas2 [Pseudodesulfovibrio thermohalotolerans]WFS63050.1 CRISPR-associated endonuclease Cas2 [Pseudodesulfovibrio thermohalotolerans]
MRTELSGYRIMWMMVMFDLPVVTSKERKAAGIFRKHLQNLGFEMAQFSIYYRVMGSKEIAKRYLKQIEEKVPKDGSVNILTITDKQYENMVCFTGREKVKPPEVLQLSLF